MNPPFCMCILASRVNENNHFVYCHDMAYIFESKALLLSPTLLIEDAC